LRCCVKSKSEARNSKSERKKRTKKDKKSQKIEGNNGFLREILKNGVAGDSKKRDFIGLMRF
jgi:hypothetical protein